VQGLVAAKPPESSKPVRWGTKSNVVRGGCRKTSAEEMDLSMEGAPDRAVVRSSRVSLRNGLGVVRVCGPMRRDSQAGTSARRDRRVTGSVDDGRRGRKRLYVRAKKQTPRVDPPKPPRCRENTGCSIAHPTGGNSSRVGGEHGIRKESVGARRDLVESERGTGARD